MDQISGKSPPKCLRCSLFDRKRSYQGRAGAVWRHQLTERNHAKAEKPHLSSILTDVAATIRFRVKGVHAVDAEGGLIGTEREELRVDAQQTYSAEIIGDYSGVEVYNRQF